MSLENLEKIGQLERIAPAQQDIARLLDAAKRSLNDARLTGLSAEGRFDMAYKSVMQLANAALQAKGYRTLTSKTGHHLIMIQSLALTADVSRDVVIQLDALRKQRNVIDYSGDLVSDSMAEEACRHAGQLLQQVATLLDEIHR